ncbi:type IV secretory system conjugative DNA transfer family protein [Streptomonospora wellingtoniae]|uniref:Type IV secretion system DNA-binding domain-containing protein n=1 Tax=Streptomonospora wellingtoniae TaxID=3075544 RepID=A0ABU2KYD9_9ACTN|nr:type IV secretion system DNA-binding domain-containing protein [Streptomonospora sp. DSM 45055]MDT0304322.1 type IV secretion system DNA-binding domain-containing protein [Streptomonospora sp. DSM 45055]
MRTSGIDTAIAHAGPAIGLAAATGAAALVAVAVLRWLRYRLAAQGARLVEIHPPPTATLEGAEAFWSQMPGLLRPRWSRMLAQPHLAWEYTAAAAGISIRVWVPGTIPPGLVARAAAAAWPGATTTTRPAAPAVPAGQKATGGWMRLARGDEYPLRTRFHEDPLRGLLGALSGLEPGQYVCVRVCARPVTGPRLARARAVAARLRGAHTALWADAFDPGRSGRRGVLPPDVSENVRAILTKAQSPRLACQVSYHLATTLSDSEAGERMRGRAAAVAGALAVFSGPNHLRRGLLMGRMWAPRVWAHRRYLARGYLLSTLELAALAHLPTDAAVPGLARAGARSIPPVPAVPTGEAEPARVVGDADAGPTRPVALGVPEARQHTHIIGATGKGKSTLLANLALQDAKAGRAALVIDPRGDLITDILARLPEHAADKTILFDPDDNAPPPRLNLLHGADADFVSDTVVGIFRRIYAHSWGPRTDDILRAATLTLARTGDPTLTLGEIPPLLTDENYRRSITARVRDPVLAGFWDWYEQLSSGARAAATGPVLNKLRTALLRPWVRQVIASGPSTVDLASAFDTGRLVLLRLPKGVLGEDTSSLVGALGLAATWQTVTARVSKPEHERPDVGAFIDEAHNFLLQPGSLADMLAEARGYRLSLTLAHQELGQLPTELRKALAANARSKIYFTCSPEDAAALEAHTLPGLGAHDLTHLGEYQVAARLLVGAVERPVATLRTRPLPPPVPGRATAVRKAARHHTPHPPAAQHAPALPDVRTRL